MEIVEHMNHTSASRGKCGSTKSLKSRAWEINKCKSQVSKRDWAPSFDCRLGLALCAPAAAQAGTPRVVHFCPSCGGSREIIKSTDNMLKVIGTLKYRTFMGTPPLPDRSDYQTNMGHCVGKGIRASYNSLYFSENICSPSSSLRAFREVWGRTLSHTLAGMER